MAVEQEIWRNLGIILINRHVFRRSVLAQDMRQSISVVLDLLKSLEQVSRARVARESLLLDFWSLFYTTPSFLVGSLLVDTEDRQYIRRILQELGTEKALEDMLMVLELCWNATDATGQVADWYAEAQRLDLGVVFF